MPSPRQRIGGLAENQAVLFLTERGFQILARHVTSRFGEIDILAQDGDTIVAVEVKTRRSHRFGTAAEAVTAKKLEAIAATLHTYLDQQRHRPGPIRIDVIAISPDGVDHIRGVEMPTD